MDDTSIKAMTVSPGDVIVVELDLGMVPNAVVTRHVEATTAKIKEFFPDNKVMILPMHKSRLSVVRFADAPEETITDVEYTDVNS